MARAEAGKPRGRPRDPRKREAIINAARRLFFARGVEAVSMEAIAAEAKVSKMTLYGLFSTRETVFEAVITEASTQLVGDLSDDMGGSAAPLSSASLEHALLGAGERVLEFTQRRDVVGFGNVMALEAHRHPDLMRRFFELGPGRARAVLAALIGRAARDGLLDVDDPLAAADDFSGLLQGMSPLELQLGVAAPANARQRTARAKRAVSVFLRAYARR